MAKLEFPDDSINPANYEIGVMVARMQVDNLHEAHIALIEKVIENHSNVILFLGVARIPNSKKYPLDFETRKIMVEDLYPNITILPLNNMRYDEDWVKQVDGLIHDTFGEGKALLYGSRDSFIPHYKPHGKHTTVELTTDVDVSGSAIREKISKEVRNSSDFRAGLIRANSLKWDVTYPTVDVCGINRNDELLLARKPNEKLFRFVGGFVDPTDASLEAAAKREFSEETDGVEISNLQYITSSKVNDWRYADLGDGIMTTLFLGTVEIEDVTLNGGDFDDIEELKWFSLKEELVLENFIEENIVPEHVNLMKILVNGMVMTLLNDMASATNE